MLKPAGLQQTARLQDIPRLTGRPAPFRSCTQQQRGRRPYRQQRSVDTRRHAGVRIVSSASSSNVDAQTAEAAVLDALQGIKGRGSGGLPADQQAAFDDAVKALEADGGVKAPTASDQINGRWRLLYTSKPGTASPIQRTFTGQDAFSIFQDITLQDVDLPLIVNVVEFGKSGVLRVEAEANTDSRPLPGFVPRKGPGLPLFGKSSTYPPPGPDIRIDFQFSKGAFDFSFLPFTIPYPVPFKALGDETKGFIDVTYMSSQANGLRLSRGNKGTLFVLQKAGAVPPSKRG